MKTRSVLFIAGLFGTFSSFPTYSQNIGIGTLYPDAALHVQRYSTNNYPLFVVENTFDQTSKMAFKTDFRTWMIGQNKPPDDPGLWDAFFIYDSNASTSRFIITISGNIGIGTTSPSARLHLNETGSGKGVVFAGEWQASPADPPVSGAGTRMMWYPDKGAFRAGVVTGTYWNKDSTGMYSLAAGYNCKAKGEGAIALGKFCTANDDASIALGYLCLAKGFSAFAAGYNNQVNSAYSTSTGAWNIVSGGYSTALGYYNVARSGYETALGCYNTDYTPTMTNSWYGNDRLFVIGNGQSYLLLSNAVTILKNGCIGLQSMENPTYAMHLPNTSNPANGSGRAYAWTTYSDERIKTDVQPISYGLKEIMDLQPVKYFHHNSVICNKQIRIDEAGENSIGFIAQQVYDKIPEAVFKPADESGELWGLSYEKLIPVLTRAIQEQQILIVELQIKVEQLQQQLSVYE